MFIADLRRTFRSLAKAPGFSAAVILTLALGIGANTAMFTLLRGTMLRPLPNKEGERLVYLRQSAPGAGQANVLFSVPEIVDYRSASKTMAEVAEYSSMTFTMETAEEPTHIQAGVISGNYFDVMGLDPVLGRVTTPADDGAAAPPVGVLSHQFWTSHFGADSSVIGRVVRVNDMSLVIIGVAQRVPHYPARTDMFVNMVTSPHHLDATMQQGRTHRMTEVFARLAPLATVEQTRTEIAGLAANVHRDHPEAYEAASQYQIQVAPLRDALNERARTTLWFLLAASGFVLLIACANVANLTLMRSVRREREVLVRAALGARAWQLRKLLLLENLALALIGGALGVGIAFVAIELLVKFAEQLTPRADEIRVDGLVLGVTLGITLLAAVALSFAPKLGGELAGRLAAAGKKNTANRSRQRMQQGLVVAQLAVCVVLLTAAGLLVRTLVNLQSTETGVRAENALTMELPIESSTIPSHEKLAMYERMRDRIALLPGVATVGIGSNVPLRFTPFMLEIKAEGQPVESGVATPRAVYKTANPDYLAAAGIPLLSGRNFDVTDQRDGGRVVLLSQSFAERLFPGQDPIGRRVAWTGEVLNFIPVSGDWRTVVGVVGDTRDSGLDSAPTPTLFQPITQEEVFAGAMVVRTTLDPAGLAPEVERVIRELYPRQLIENLQTLEEVRDATVAPRRLNALFITAFGALAMLIAIVGIAGVLAFSVSSRTAEIGIRLSLGADGGRVRRMILGEGGLLLVIGLGVGAAAALLGTRMMQGLLYGVAPHDPLTLVAVCAVLGVVGVAACYLPAVRAARVHPAVALRSD